MCEPLGRITYTELSEIYESFELGWNNFKSLYHIGRT
jgi:hypothetical protein